VPVHISPNTYLASFEFAVKNGQFELFLTCNHNRLAPIVARLNLILWYDFYAFVTLFFMNILLIGSGGREHALALKMHESPLLDQLFIAPGNPGTALLGENVPISDSDIPALLEFALSHSIGLTIVGPEGPLAAGLADIFRANGLRVVGPGADGAQLESSKSWSKGIMAKAGIPTAAYGEFSDFDSAVLYLDAQNSYPIVIKADGLAAGKGVTVATDRLQAVSALENCFKHDAFGSAGSRVVIEAFLLGQEASIFAFCDGDSFLPMIAAQDHKAVFDRDAGPNTGGMGAYAPAPIVTPSVAKAVNEQVFRPLLTQLKKEGIHYCGIIYAGLMIDNGQINVVEFNARFGDPETQIVLPLLKTDLLSVFVAMVDGCLSKITLEWEKGSAVCVVMSAPGYPGPYEKNIAISGLKSLNARDCYVVHAGTRLSDGAIRSNGGRVLSVVGIDHTLEAAINKAYSGIHKISFKGGHFRTDIGSKAL
jgi:phosphoribosylamine---glycine ligase